MTTAKYLMKKNFLKIDIKDTAAKLIGHMKKNHVTYALVFDNKKYKGLVDKRWLLSSRIDSEHLKIKNLLKKRSKTKTPFYVPEIKQDTELKEICRLMAAANTRALPVINKQKTVIAVVEASRLLKEIRNKYRGIDTDELASMKLITAEENENMGKVLEKMHLNKIDRVPIINKSKKLAGIATLNDIIKYYQRWPITAQKIRAKGQNRAKKANVESGEKQDRLKAPIRNVMIPAPVCKTAGAKTKIPQIIDIMTREHICSVIIKKYQKPIGIITAQDILKDYSL